jgi:hypothetical protein
VYLVLAVYFQYWRLAGYVPQWQLRMRKFVSIAAVLFAGCVGSAATLEQLSLDEMTQKSTAIVRGRVGNCTAGFRGSVIYTHCTITVTERWKGAPAPTVDVSLPGGTARGFIQTFAGTPELKAGQEHIFFLWTGKSGITQIMGLSQGVFDLKTDTKGNTLVQRLASQELMLDHEGTPVEDQAIRMPLSDLHKRVTRALAAKSPRAEGSLR